MKKRYEIIDLCKWSALLIMLISHSLKVFAWDWWRDYFSFISVAGFPLFAFAFAYTTKTGYRSGLPGKLLLWAVVAQVPFSVVFGFRLNILFAFAWSLLPFPFSALACATLGQVTDGGVIGCAMLLFARYARMPELPEFSIGVPRAKAYPVLYALHLWILIFVAIRIYS